MGKNKLSILIAPLDWGLGHTVRCIPIIRELTSSGNRVIVACNSKQQQIIAADVQGLTYFHLDGYNLRYGETRTKTIWQIIFQVPKILINIKRERNWLKAFLQDNEVDAVISDNRFGFYTTRVCSIYMTHQLNIRSGLGRWMDRMVQSFHFHYIEKFKECWVPDFEGDENLGGALSHPRKTPKTPVHYIGPLSRLEKCNEHKEKNIDLLFILSGPEPQRTIFENIIVRELQKVPMNATLVRGLPNATDELAVGPNVTVINYANGQQLNVLMCSASLICCRSGYTSIMDIMKLGKKSILVPTPGQAEQEYLGEYLFKKQLALTVKQSEFDFEKVLEQLKTLLFKRFDSNMDGCKRWVKEFTEISL